LVVIKDSTAAPVSNGGVFDCLQQAGGNGALRIGQLALSDNRFLESG
jgi:hypothetical protein